MSFFVDTTTYGSLPVAELTQPMGYSKATGRAPNRTAPDIGGNSGTRATLQPWSAEFRKSLEPLRALQAGWAGPGSEAIDNKIFYRVEQYLALALARTPNPKLPYVVPTNCGGLQIEWHQEQIELEVLFEPSGSISALLEDHDQALEIEEYGNAALDLLLRWAPRAAQARNYARNVEATPAPPPLQMVA